MIPQPIPWSADAPASGTGDREGMQHQTPRATRKAHELEYEAATGTSEKTPLILFGELWVVYGIAALIITALALVAYRLA